MCTLALTLGDFKIAQTSLDSLRKFPESNHSMDLYLLNAQFHLLQVLFSDVLPCLFLQGNVTQAQDYICRGIHIFPTRLYLWNELNNIISHHHRDSMILANVARDLGSSLCQVSFLNSNYR